MERNIRGKDIIAEPEKPGFVKEGDGFVINDVMYRIGATSKLSINTTCTFIEGMIGTNMDEESISKVLEKLPYSLRPMDSTGREISGNMSELFPQLKSLIEDKKSADQKE